MGPRPGIASFNESWLSATRDVHLATTPVFGIIAVPDAGNPEQLIEAGRRWQRFHLEATIHGLGAHPLDQAIEAVERTRYLSAAPIQPSPNTLAPSGFQLAIMFRTGYPLHVAHASARRPLASMML